MAERAAELSDYSDPSVLATLGVAYAAAERFDEAIKVNENALAIALDAENSTLAEKLRQRVELFRKGLPYIDDHGL